MPDLQMHDDLIMGGFREINCIFFTQRPGSEALSRRPSILNVPKPANDLQPRLPQTPKSPRCLKSIQHTPKHMPFQPLVGLNAECKEKMAYPLKGMSQGHVGRIPETPSKSRQPQHPGARGLPDHRSGGSTATPPLIRALPA